MSKFSKEIMEVIEAAAEKASNKTVNKVEKTLKQIQDLENSKRTKESDYFEASKKALRIYYRLKEYIQDEEVYIEKYLELQN